MTTEEIASKIIYLKENNFIPNLDNETRDVQSIIRSFYKCEKTNKHGTDKSILRLIFTNYNVSDEFVREVNREFKRFKILNIGKEEY